MKYEAVLAVCFVIISERFEEIFVLIDKSKSLSKKFCEHRFFIILYNIILYNKKVE